jgi:hypothetical protein
MNQEQAAIGYINSPTPAMKRCGVKDWSKLDAELIRLATAWPNDSVPDRCLFYYWARKIHKSVSTVATVTVSDSAVTEVLKNVVPRFPLLNTFADWSAFRSAAGNMAELIADLDEPTRLALACIYWRWGQVAVAIQRGRREVKWKKERAESQQQTCVFKLRPEHKQAIDGFRRSFRVELPNGQPQTDAQVAGHFFDAAFLIPDQIYEATRRLIRYRDAEGLKPDDAIRAMSLAASAIVAISETVTPAATLPSSQPTEATLDEANKLCDPALSEFTLDLGAAGRLQLVDRFERWVKQLRASAALLQAQAQRRAA